MHWYYRAHMKQIAATIQLDNLKRSFRAAWFTVDFDTGRPPATPVKLLHRSIARDASLGGWAHNRHAMATDQTVQNRALV